MLFNLEWCEMRAHVGEVGQVIEVAMTCLNAHARKASILRIILNFEQ